MRHQIMRQRSFFRHLTHEHRDRAANRLIDVNDENFVAIPDENRATATGWEHGANMYLNDRFVHRVDGTDGRTKNKLLQPLLPRLTTVSHDETATGDRPGPFPIGPMCPTVPTAHR